jgi:hypothetical protein
MIHAIQSKELFPLMQKYMFTSQNIGKGYMRSEPMRSEPMRSEPMRSEPMRSNKRVSATVVPTVPVPATIVPIVNVPVLNVPTAPFTPSQKDKLFWCFFILLKGYEEYEMARTSAFSIEKKIKIETVEKLKGIKEKLKALKLKRTELEDNLVNHSTISLKGLCALCLVHNISVTYVYGRKYCVINEQVQEVPTIQEVKKGIIIQNSKKEDSLRWHDASDDFMTNIRENYWFIENIQKPLNAPSAYTLKDLQDICRKLEIPLETTVNEKSKQKTKSKLYEEILAHL